MIIHSNKKHYTKKRKYIVKMESLGFEGLLGQKLKDGSFIQPGRIYIKTLRLVCYIEEEKVVRSIEYHRK